MPFIIKKLHVKEETKAFLFLIQNFNYSQRDAQRVISKGRLLINGEPMLNSSKMVQGVVELIMFEPSTRGLNALHVEDNFVVFNKPSGVLIHPQNRNTQYSLVDELKYQYGMDANIAHRIDQETSGLVLCARNKEYEKKLKLLFQNREIEKHYLAFVHGKVKKDIFIDEPLLRKEDESAIVRMVVKVHPDGKESQTLITPLEYYPDLNITLVDAKPHTGRQHQIRVHLFHVKHPIVGDPIYAQKESNILKFLDKEISKEQRIELSGSSRLLLHASQLSFTCNGNKYSIKSDNEFKEETLIHLRNKLFT
ncbi:MAG: RluA family pseudouridine synthase [Campylobacterota bacterium]|nr:RluA family pseudouridine synthase [Campylobacterota bacterium]